MLTDHASQMLFYYIEKVHTVVLINELHTLENNAAEKIA